MIEIKLTFTSVAEAAAFLAGREPGNALAATVTTAGQSAPSASSTKPDAAAAKAAQVAKAKADAAAKAKAEADETAHEEPAGDAKIDYDTQVKPLVVKLAALGDFVQAFGPFAAIRAHQTAASRAMAAWCWKRMFLNS